jgi:hypothetical protein
MEMTIIILISMIKNRDGPTVPVKPGFLTIFGLNFFSKNIMIAIKVLILFKTSCLIRIRDQKSKKSKRYPQKYLRPSLTVFDRMPNTSLCYNTLLFLIWSKKFFLF